MSRFLFVLSSLFSPLYASAAVPADSSLLVREVIIQGNRVTRESVILREMILRPGAELTQEAIDRDRDRIYNLGLFNRVDVDSTVRGRDAVVLVTVSERWYIFPFPIIGFRHRDVKKLYYGLGFAHQNFRGRNEKLWISFALGYDQWVTMNYENPRITDGGDLYLNASMSYQQTHSLGTSNGEYLNRTAAGYLTLGERFGFYQTAYITAGFETWQVSQFVPGRTASASGRDAFGSLGIRYRYDTRNIREYATAGSFLGLALVKSGMKGNAVDLMSAGLDARTYVPLGDDYAVGFRTMSNLIWGGEIPQYRRSSFGYDERVRGYFNNRTESDDQLLASAELRIPIIHPRTIETSIIRIPQFQTLRYGLYAGVFADAARSWNRNDHLMTGPWLAGAGAGLHLLLPYGATLRAEYAMNDRGIGEVFLDLGASF